MDTALVELIAAFLFVLAAILERWPDIREMIRKICEDVY